MTDYSQPFLPPIQHLVGGSGAWDQNLSATAPFSSQLSGELYSNLAKAPELGAFSVSAMGNREREQYAMDKSNQFQSSLFPDERTNWFDQHSQNMWNARNNVYGPMSNGGSSSAFPTTPAPNATSMAIVPYNGGFGSGGQSFMSPSMFGGGAGGSQVGGGMDDVKYIGDAKSAIHEMAIVLKQDFTPQIQAVTKMMGGGGSTGFGRTTGPDIVLGGNGSSSSFGGFGGFLGSGGGGNGGGNSGGAFNNGNLTGFERGFPNMNDGAYDGGGGGLGLHMPGMFKIRQGYNMFIRPAMNDMNSYMNQSAAQSQMLQGSGMISYGDMMGGQYGAIQRREAASQEFQLGMGRNIYSAYGGIANSVMGGDAARSAGGAFAAIGQVSAGAALVGAGIGAMFGPLGAGAGALLGGGAAAIIGAGGYAADSAKDPYAIGSYLSSGDRFGDFRGAVGVGVENLRYVAGTRSPQETQQLRNSRAYAANVNAFAAGDVSTSDLKSWSSANGFSGADAVGAGLEKFYADNASLGFKRDQQEPVLGLDLMLNPSRLPGSMPQRLTLDPVANARNRANGAGLFSEQMSLGSTYAPFMQGFLPGAAGAMGVSASDQGGMNGLMNMYTNRMYDVQQAGGNVSLYQAQLQGQVAPIGRINQARYQAGYGSVLGLDNYSGLDANPYIKADVQGIDLQRYGYEASSPGFAQNVSRPILNRAQAYSQQGRPAISSRLQSMLPDLNRMYSSAESYGADASGALLGLSELAATNEQMGAVGFAIAGGDRRVLSQYASAIGDERLNTMNPQTGMPVRYNSMSRSQYNMMRQDQPNLFNLSFDQAQGGEKQWEQNILNSQRGFDLYQYQQATAGRNINQLTQTGGAFGVNAQGFAVGGDGLAGLSQLFQSQGMKLQAGNGMGMWQVQDAQTAISRQQQQYGFNQQGANMALSNQQWNESFAMNQQQFNLSTAYQAQNMQISRNQQTTQEGWQGQDLGMSRNRMELSFGWQMQDFDRNIRFARGRDRIDLQRQQERAVITHSMDETQQGQQEDRFKTETQWNKEEFDRKKQYFDQSKSLSQQEMDMNKRHHDETQALNLQAHEKEKQFMIQEFALQDQQRLLTRQSDQVQFKMQTDMAIAVENTRKSIIPYQDALKASGLEYQEQEGHIKMLTMDMSVLAQWLDVVHGKVNSMTGNNNNSGGGKGPTPTPYITSASHPGEVSNNIVGSTASSSPVALLIEIRNHLRAIEAMGPGRVTATIYTNDTQVKTSNLYQKSLRTVN